MKTKFNLSVKTPCSEKFENFKKTASGGFCNSCTKEVIDFTSMSDQEIIVFLNNRKESICGRLNQSQLKTYTIPVVREKRSSYSRVAAFGLSVVSILSATTSLAQETKPMIEVASLTTKKSDNLIMLSDKDDIIFKGQVKDKEGILPGVSILIKGTTKGAETNFDGNFSVNAKIGDVLVFSYLGYKTKEIRITKNTKFIQVIMSDDETMILGAIDVGPIYKSKRTQKEKRKN